MHLSSLKETLERVRVRQANRQTALAGMFKVCVCVCLMDVVLNHKISQALWGN